eukprot:TRINITY_DN10298_c0_g1_i1.p1 TRINITY_DN10298_c0_g1~~TRINITY_DN10298_c0_g1_i1.p1  ORF type:complete len:181 (-),score=21.37 TRINITY_DN10298_c0_g1_i1:94-636(-)
MFARGQVPSLGSSHSKQFDDATVAWNRRAPSSGDGWESKGVHSHQVGVRKEASKDSQQLLPSRVSATSMDPARPPWNLLRPDAGAWVSTGLYPQTLSFAFDGAAPMTRVTIKTAGVVQAKMRFLGPNRALLATKALKPVHGDALITSLLDVEVAGVSHVDLVITSGQGPFCSVHAAEFWS